MSGYVQRFGPTALVVGASATVGEQYARQLAARGMDVVLVARRAERLEEIAREIRAAHGVRARVIALDLLQEGALASLFEQTRSLEIGYLVVNANLHKINDFDLLALETKRRIVQMNVMVPTLLCDHYGPLMTARGRGAVFLSSALNFLMGLEKDAVFQGSKAYLSIFAESLWLEYRKKGVAVCAGLFNGIEGSSSYEAKSSPATRKVMRAFGMSMPPERIVARCLEGVEKGEPLVIPDHPLPSARAAFLLTTVGKMVRSPRYSRFLSDLTLRLLNGEGLTR
ncbi:MAG: SDR family NAD(P)-dependent oxidoreductase [Myxococcota bacterium]